jgi:hypothetical protein
MVVVLEFGLNCPVLPVFVDAIRMAAVAFDDVVERLAWYVIEATFSATTLVFI